VATLAWRHAEARPDGQPDGIWILHHPGLSGPAAGVHDKPTQRHARREARVERRQRLGQGAASVPLAYAVDAGVRSTSLWLSVSLSTSLCFLPLRPVSVSLASGLSSGFQYGRKNCHCHCFRVEGLGFPRNCGRMCTPQVVLWHGFPTCSLEMWKRGTPVAKDACGSASYDASTRAAVPAPSSCARKVPVR
jgi:hypothetical protein